MGGEMLSGFLWSLVALLCGLGSGAVVPWYGVPLVVIAVYGLSLGIRSVIRQVVRDGSNPTFHRWRILALTVISVYSGPPSA